MIFLSVLANQAPPEGMAAGALRLRRLAGTVCQPTRKHRRAKDDRIIQRPGSRVKRGKAVFEWVDTIGSRRTLHIARS